MSDSAANNPRDQHPPGVGPDGDDKFILFGQVDEATNPAVPHGREPDAERLVAGHRGTEPPIRQASPAFQILQDAGAFLSPPPPPLPLAVPPVRQLGDYQLLRLVGRGGMGIVYEAEQVSLRRRVAVKVLPMSAAWDDHRLQRFQNEAHAAARLHHQNIVPVYTVGCEHGVHYFAMQYLEGQTIAQVITELSRTGVDAVDRHVTPQNLGSCDTTLHHVASGSIEVPPADAASRQDLPGNSGPGDSSRSSGSAWQTRRFYRYVATLGIQAAEALAHAHQHQVIHRDIKPSNLLVEQSGHLWIMDFGLAQFPGDTDITATGDVVGTARYMSPEQALAERPTVDHRSDIYSLGVTLYELLTLRPAIDGRTYEEILRQIRQSEPRRPRRVNRSIPADLETIVLKAIAKDPAARYATAQHLADDLQRFLLDEPVLAKRPSFARIGVSFLRRHRRTVMTAVLSAMTVVTIVALAILFAPRAEPPATIAHREANQGVRLRALGQYDDAIVHLTKALQQDPGNDRYWTDRAACFRDVGQFSRAYDDLTQALAIRRDLSTLYDRVRIAQKLELWDHVAGDYGELFRHSLLTDPTKLDLFNLERHSLQRQLESNPDAVWLWVAQAVSKMRIYDTAGAVDDLQHVLALAPDSHWVLGQLGSVHLYRGELDEAIAELSRAIRLQQDCAAYWANRAAARGLLGMFDEGLSDVAQAVELAPKAAVPLQIRGRIRSQSGQTEAAIADFEASLWLDPDGELQMWSHFANAIRRRGTTEKDRQFAEEFLRRNPDRAVAHAHWGNVCLYAGQTEEAIESLVTASQMKRHDPFVKRKLYEALLALDDLDRAKQTLGELAQGGNSPADWWYLAELHRMSGQVDVYREICQGLLTKQLVPLLAGCVVLTCAETPDLQPYEPRMIDIADAAGTQHPYVQMQLARARSATA